ncbi:TOMM precursor leader peptide-binding protein [Streptomyces sp. x-80]|uniref:TOMM precursor leader peptide-binding protein n=1 Tax=Streptomyces sp. x-80 TaxID=2789282 RepID=UPI0039814AA1
MTVTTTPTHVLWTGDFGERVAARLASMTGCPTLRADARGRRTAEWPHTGLRLVAAWRAEEELFAQVARLHSATRTPWLPIVHEYPMIRIGPLVMPGKGACYGCYVRRRAQHDRGSAAARALRASAAADPDHGVAGFTEGQAMIGTALALDLVGRWETGAGDRAGQVLFYNVLTRSLITDTVVRVHGCSECGNPPHPDDGWRHLAADLTHAPAGGAR